jgi:hypothetical protein
MKAARFFTSTLLIATAAGTTMCAEHDGARIRMRPVPPAAAGEGGDASGTMPGSAGTLTGRSGQNAGGRAGGSGDGDRAASAGEGGAPGEAGSGRGGSRNSDESSEGGSGALPSEGSGGSPSAGAGDGTTGGSAASAGNSGGTSGAGAGTAGAGGGNGEGTAGSAGGGACGEPTGCCAPSDPSCFSGCGDEGYCCHPVLGARLACDFDVVNTDVVCIDSCTARSFGRDNCDSCLVDGDPSCADPSWDDACDQPSGSGFCSDIQIGVRLRCFNDGSGTKYTLALCTCDSETSCVPTPCCGDDEPSCEPDGCDPLGAGSCCSSTNNFHSTCESRGNYEITQETLCINDCTGRSFGTFGCVECTSRQDPFCDADLAWTADCANNNGDPVFCSDPVRGFRMACTEAFPGSGDLNVEVVCACDSSRR